MPSGLLRGAVKRRDTVRSARRYTGRCARRCRTRASPVARIEHAEEDVTNMPCRLSRHSSSLTRLMIRSGSGGIAAWRARQRRDEPDHRLRPRHEERRRRALVRRRPRRRSTACRPRPRRNRRGRRRSARAGSSVAKISTGAAAVGRRKSVGTMPSWISRAAAARPRSARGAQRSRRAAASSRGSRRPARAAASG